MKVGCFVSILVEKDEIENAREREVSVMFVEEDGSEIS